MEPFSLRLGWLVVKVNRRCLVVFPHGSNGRHFTLYFTPNRGGNWTPHLTNPRVGRPHFLGSWSTQAGQRLTDVVGDAWGKAWLAALQPADLPMLDAEGWVAIRPTEKDLRRWVDSHLKTGPGTYRLRATSLRHLGSLAEDGARCLLDLTPEEGSSPVSILRCSDAGEVDSRFLAFLPEGSWGEAGWYGWPSRLLSPEDALQPIFAHCGPPLVQALRTMNRWLRLNGKEEALAMFGRWASPPCP